MKMFKKAIVRIISVICTVMVIAVPVFFAEEIVDTSTWEIPETMKILEGGISNLNEGMYAVYDEDTGLYGFNNLNSDAIISPQFLSVDAFYEGLAAVSQVYDRIGYINYKGEYIIPPVFEYGSSFYDGKAIVNCPDGYQIIDKSGKYLLKKNYDDISKKDDIYLCQLDGSTDLLDIQLNLIKNIPVLAEEIYESNGVEVAVFYDEVDGFGAISLDSDKIIIPASPNVNIEYENDLLISNNWDEVMTIIYDFNGKELISAPIVHALSKEVFLINEIVDDKNSKSYLVKNGVKEECDFVMSFNILDNLFVILDDYGTETSKVGVLDEKGNFVIPLEERVKPIQIWDKNKLAIENKDEIIIYDKKGNELERRKAIGLYSTNDEYAFCRSEDDSKAKVTIYDFDFNQVAEMPGASYAFWEEYIGAIQVTLNDLDMTSCLVVYDEDKLINKPEGSDLKPVGFENFDYDYVSKTLPVYFQIGNCVKYSDGETTMISGYFDNNDRTPYIENDRTMMLASHLSNSGFPMEIMTKESVIDIAYNNKMLTVFQNNDIAKLMTFNYNTYQYEATQVHFKAPSGFNETDLYYAYLPIKQLADILGFSVSWDAQASIVELSATPISHTDDELNTVRKAFDTKFTLDQIKKLDASLSIQPYLDRTIADMLNVKYEEINSYNLANYSNTIPGYEALIKKEKDLILVTQPSKEMLELASKNGVELEIVPFAKEGFVFLVNADNKVESLSVDQLRDIYSGKIKNWKEVGGADIPIVPYQRNESSGSQTIMEDVFMDGYDLMLPLTEQKIMSMEGLVDIVAEYKPEENGALGYSVYYYAKTMYGTDKVRLIKVNGVEPASKTIASDEYPIIVNYYAVKRKDDNSETTKKLLDYFLSTQGQKLVTESGLVPIK